MSFRLARFDFGAQHSGERFSISGGVGLDRTQAKALACWRWTEARQKRFGNSASSKLPVVRRSNTALQPGYWKTALTKEAFRARRIFSWRNQLIGRTYLSTTPTIKHATQLANKVERLIQKEMMLRVFHLNHFKLRLEWFHVFCTSGRKRLA